MSMTPVPEMCSETICLTADLSDQLFSAFGGHGPPHALQTEAFDVAWEGVHFDSRQLHLLNCKSAGSTPGSST